MNKTVALCTLCCLLRSGIKGLLHGVHKVFPQSNGWTRDTGGPEECPAEAGGAAQRLSSSMPFNPNADVDPNIGAAPYQTRYPLTIQTQHRLWMRPL